jgi:2'-5' RNA ligase
MDGIVTTLPEPYTSKLLGIWNDIENEFGFNGVKATPIPHFTWHVAADYNLAKVKNELKILIKDIKPFVVKTKGLSHFKKSTFVAYISIHKNKELTALHHKICEQLSIHSTDALDYYLPLSWVPHITIVREGDIFNPKQVNDFIRKYDLNWSFVVDSLSIIRTEKNNTAQIQFTQKFL